MKANQFKKVNNNVLKSFNADNFFMNQTQDQHEQSKLLTPQFGSSQQYQMYKYDNIFQVPYNISKESKQFNNIISLSDFNQKNLSTLVKPLNGPNSQQNLSQNNQKQQDSSQQQNSQSQQYSSEFFDPYNAQLQIVKLITIIENNFQAYVQQQNFFQEDILQDIGRLRLIVIEYHKSSMIKSIDQDGQFDRDRFQQLIKQFDNLDHFILLEYPYLYQYQDQQEEIVRYEQMTDQQFQQQFQQLHTDEKIQQIIEQAQIQMMFNQFGNQIDQDQKDFYSELLKRQKRKGPLDQVFKAQNLFQDIHKFANTKQQESKYKVNIRNPNRKQQEKNNVSINTQKYVINNFNSLNTNLFKTNTNSNLQFSKLPSISSQNNNTNFNLFNKSTDTLSYQAFVGKIQKQKKQQKQQQIKEKLAVIHEEKKSQFDQILGKTSTSKSEQYLKPFLGPFVKPQQSPLIIEQKNIFQGIINSSSCNNNNPNNRNKLQNKPLFDTKYNSNNLNKNNQIKSNDTIKFNNGNFSQINRNKIINPFQKLNNQNSSITIKNSQIINYKNQQTHNESKNINKNELNTINHNIMIKNGTINQNQNGNNNLKQQNIINQNIGNLNYNNQQINSLPLNNQNTIIQLSNLNNISNINQNQHLNIQQIQNSNNSKTQNVNPISIPNSNPIMNIKTLNNLNQNPNLEINQQQMNKNNLHLNQNNTFKFENVVNPYEKNNISSQKSSSTPNIFPPIILNNNKMNQNINIHPNVNTNQNLLLNQNNGFGNNGNNNISKSFNQNSIKMNNVPINLNNNVLINHNSNNLINNPNEKDLLIIPGVQNANNQTNFKSPFLQTPTILGPNANTNKINNGVFVQPQQNMNNSQTNNLNPNKLGINKQLKPNPFIKPKELNLQTISNVPQPFIPNNALINGINIPNLTSQSTKSNIEPKATNLIKQKNQEKSKQKMNTIESFKKEFGDVKLNQFVQKHLYAQLKQIYKSFYIQGHLVKQWILKQNQIKLLQQQNKHIQNNFKKSKKLHSTLNQLLNQSFEQTQKNQFNWEKSIKKRKRNLNQIQQKQQKIQIILQKICQDIAQYEKQTVNNNGISLTDTEQQVKLLKSMDKLQYWLRDKKQVQLQYQHYNYFNVQPNIKLFPQQIQKQQIGSIQKQEKKTIKISQFQILSSIYQTVSIIENNLNRIEIQLQNF